MARRLTPLLTLPLWAVATASVLNDHVLEILSVRGSSMSPTLSSLYHDTGARDTLLVRKYAPTTGLERGDVVAFWAPHRPDHLVVKRVVGLEGDRVTLDERRRPGAEFGARVVVPPGHVWVEGDNWRSSGDSNLYGPVSRSLITGRAVCVVWPLSRWWQRPWEEKWSTRELKTRVEPGFAMG
ncbi:hypothetical protein ANO11243_032270 [Dothideomycetidae sp. 11243]|nr:hypothetical protein ANO11243_032270 [fungal sp. No.11243]